MRKFRRALITMFLATSVFATSVFAAPTVQEIEDQKEKAEAEVKSLQDELTEIITSMNEIEMKLISKGEEIRLATEQLAEAEANEIEQQENMEKRIVAMYENGDSNIFEMFLESGSFAEMVQQVENVQALHEYDRKALQEYIETKEQIAELKVTLETEQDEMEKLQANLESQEKNLNAKIESKKAEVEDFETQLAEAVRKAAEEAERRRREEEDKKQQQTVINNNSGSSGVSYTGSGDQSVGYAIVEAARSYIGVWYEWGGNNYNGIDCSGLTKAAHAAVGIYIDRWSGHQAIGGKEIGDGEEDLDKALPGDIICYPGHVAIYIGNYRIIHAPTTGKKVQEASVYLGGVKPITAIRRYW